MKDLSELREVLARKRADLARRILQVEESARDQYVERVFKDHAETDLLGMIAILLTTMRRSAVEDFIHGESGEVVRERIRTLDMVFNQIFVAPFARAFSAAIRGYSPEEDENRFFLEREDRGSKSPERVR